MLTWPIALNICQYSGFALTIVMNSLLLYLIITKASSKFGSYKYLMMAYALYSIVYGIIEISTQPVIYVQGSGFIMFVGSFIKFEKDLSYILLVLYCGSFGFCISLLTTHFVFRYIAVCKPKRLYLFEGKRVICLLIPCFVVSIVWLTISLIIGSSSVFKTDYYKTSIEEIYGEKLEVIGYFAVIYHEFSTTGEIIIHWWDLSGVLSVSLIMAFLLVVAITCAYFTSKQVLNKNQVISRRTRDLNKQLFRALIVQFLVPLFTLFIPVGALMTFPIFRIPIGTLANISSMNAGIYPGLDATITILLIHDFRMTIFCSKRARPSIITTSKYDSTTH